MAPSRNQHGDLLKNEIHLRTKRFRDIRVYGIGFRDYVLRASVFRVWGLEFRVEGFGFRVWVYG